MNSRMLLGIAIKVDAHMTLIGVLFVGFSSDPAADAYPWHGGMVRLAAEEGQD